MSRDDFRGLLAAQPFVPFEIVVTDGSRYRVTHPDAIRLSRSSVQLLVPEPPSEAATADRSVIIALIHVMRLEQVVKRESGE